MNKFRKRLAIAVSVLIFIGIASYGVYQARAYLSGPRIVIEGKTREGPLLMLAGTAERIAFLSLQGKQIFTDENGRWQETALLMPGYNSVVVAATDRFGRKTEKHFDAYRTPKEDLNI